MLINSKINKPWGKFGLGLDANIFVYGGGGVLAYDTLKD